MIQKINVKFGFTKLEIPSLNIGYSIIKLKFNQSSVDDIMLKFFESLGFTQRYVYSKSGKSQVIFQFHVLTASNHERYEDTCKKVREFLIRKKISGLYDQLSLISPVQPMAPLEF